MSRPDFIKHRTELEEPAGTGICNTFINNTKDEARLMVIGERPRDDNRVRFPLNEAYELTRANRWADWPARPLGTITGRRTEYVAHRNSRWQCANFAERTSAQWRQTFTLDISPL